MGKKMNKREIIINKEANIFSTKNKAEKERLFIQQKLLYDYDMKIYNKYLNSNQSYNILDLGCNNGTTSFQRFKNFKIKNYVGLDLDKHAINFANKNKINDKFKFFCLDLEDDNFEKELYKITSSLNIKFDIVNCLALFSHLKNPIKLINVVKNFCNKDCLFFIRNIDDGLNICYGSRLINHGLKLLNKTKFTGYRYSGREVYKILLKSGIKNIKLENLGINNVGFSIEENLDIVNTLFGILKNSLNKEKELSIISQNNLNNLKWLNCNYEKIEKDASKEGFFINLGFMFYVAKV